MVVLYHHRYISENSGMVNNPCPNSFKVSPMLQVVDILYELGCWLENEAARNLESGRAAEVEAGGVPDASISDFTTPKGVNISTVPTNEPESNHDNQPMSNDKGDKHMSVTQSLDEVYPSRWLKADAITEGTEMVLTVQDVNVEALGTEKEAKLVLAFKESTKELALNKTNAGTLSTLFGKNPNDWIGKRIAVYPTEAAYQGKVHQVVRIKSKVIPTVQQAPAPVASEPEAPPPWQD